MIFPQAGIVTYFHGFHELALSTIIHQYCNTGKRHVHVRIVYKFTLQIFDVEFPAQIIVADSKWPPVRLLVQLFCVTMGSFTS